MSTDQRKLTKKDLRGSFWRWMFFCHSCYNYEVYQGLGATHAYSSSMKKLYDTQVELGEELAKHTIFFNSSTHVGALTHGAVLAMEEKRANDKDSVSPEFINSVKAGLMGPLAGIGDSVVQGIATPILLGIGMMLTESLGVPGPIIYVIIMSAFVLGLAYFCWMKGYEYGTEAVSKFLQGGMMQKVLGAAGILGCTVLGGLLGRYVNITSALRFTFGTTDLIVQTDFINLLAPNLLSILATFGVYYLLKKGVKSSRVIVILFAVGLVCALLGILGPVPVRG